MISRIYLAGSMGGKPGNGFADFDRAKELMQDVYPACTIISPADVDRANGVDENFFLKMSKKEEQTWLHNTIKMDLDLLQSCDAIFMIDGWRQSKGYAWVEFWAAVRQEKRIMFENPADTAQFDKHQFRGEF